MLTRYIKRHIRAYIQKRGYELYRRPWLPKGVDVFDSLVSHWPEFCPRVIFDVGANVGQSVARLRPHFPEAEIHSFEPMPSSFELLRRNVSHDARTHAHCLALADRDGEMRVRPHNQSDLSSLNPALAPDSHSGGEPVRIELQTLDGFCRGAGIGHVGLLKIDVEGFELSVLAGAKTMLGAGAIDFVVSEVGLRPDEPRFTPFGAVDQEMRSHGFWLIGLYEQYGWRHSQAAEFCNVLYARETWLDR